MKIVTMASTKGGSGKSTLACCLAVEAMASHERVYLLDLDPQGSFAAWWRMRGGPANPQLIRDAPTIAAAVRKVGDTGDAVMIVDTPNGPLDRIDKAIDASGCVVIPLQPGPFDILSSDAVNQLISDNHAQSRVVRVVNRAAKKNPLVAEAIAEIESHGGGSPIVIEDRHLYPTAILDGKAVQELRSKPAKVEIAALWRAVEGVLNGK